MKRIAFLTILSLLCVQSGVNAQVPGDTLWTKIYGGTGDDRGWCVQHTSDDGYVISGWTTSFGEGSNDVYLIKTDAAGDAVWTKTYGAEGSDDARCVQQTSDGGYVIAGNTQPIGIMGSYVWLIKTDSSGDTLWTRQWGETPIPNINTGRCVQLTSDGGYVISGHAQFLGNNNEDIYLIKTDSSGDTLWTQSYGGSGYEIGYWVQQTSDGGYIVIGYTTSFGNGNEDVYLVKTDSSGNVEWTKTHGGQGTDSGYSIQQTPDGGYIILGFTDSFGAGNYDVYLIKTDSVGDTVWTKTYGGVGFDKGYSVQVISDGTYIVSGTTRSFEDSSGDIYLLKLDSSGDVIWSRTYDAGIGDRGWSVRPTSDGNYIVAGYTGSPGSVDVYMLKVFGGEATGILLDEQSADFRSSMYQNYPNPFNPVTMIEFELPCAQNVRLTVYNMLGQCVTDITRGYHTRGLHRMEFDGSGLASGAYLYMLQAGDRRITKKMLLVK